MNARTEERYKKIRTRFAVSSEFEKGSEELYVILNGVYSFVQIGERLQCMKILDASKGTFRKALIDKKIDDKVAIFRTKIASKSMLVMDGVLAFFYYPSDDRVAEIDASDREIVEHFFDILELFPIDS